MPKHFNPILGTQTSILPTLNRIPKGVAQTASQIAVRARFARIKAFFDEQRRWFAVEPFEKRFIVRFGEGHPNEAEIKKWFRSHRHSARSDWNLTNGRHWYVKCSKEVALLAKLTWGGR